MNPPRMIIGLYGVANGAKKGHRVGLARWRQQPTGFKRGGIYAL